MVGQAIAARCDELGHDVAVGTRDPAASRARKDADGTSEGSFGAWPDAQPGQVALAALGTEMFNIKVVR